MITQTKHRGDATAFSTELDARVAVMEHAADHPADHHEMRHYKNEGIYVFVNAANDTLGWLRTED